MHWHTSGAVWSFGLAECLACSLVVPHGVAMSVLANERCSLVFGLAECLACKLVVQAVQSWSSALLRACTGWGSPLGSLTAFYVVHWLSSGAVWSFGLAVCLACRLEVQAVQSWSSALLRACTVVVCGRPDTSGCRGSCWVLMCLRACHPAVAPVACEVWGLVRAGWCRVVLLCVCAFGANIDGESHKCGTAADSRGEVR